MKKENQNKVLNLDYMVLDGYFSNRSPKDEPVGVYKKDYKTTQEIIDEITPTMAIDDRTVVKYMAQHGYMLDTAEDGTPIWRIYRL